MEHRGTETQRFYLEDFKISVSLCLCVQPLSFIPVDFRNLPRNLRNSAPKINLFKRFPTRRRVNQYEIVVNSFFKVRTIPRAPCFFRQQG